MIPSQLCVNGLTQRARTWKVKGGSWTDEITIAKGSVTHYITCPGHDDGTSCVGPWSRRLRRTAVPGLHCVFGGGVLYDGNTVRNIKKLGHGSGGSNGIALDGEVLKHDTRDRDTALREDRCDLRLGRRVEARGRGPVGDISGVHLARRVVVPGMPSQHALGQLVDGCRLRPHSASVPRAAAELDARDGAAVDGSAAGCNGGLPPIDSARA
jgi:hypothetical protein